MPVWGRIESRAKSSPVEKHPLKISHVAELLLIEKEKNACNQLQTASSFVMAIRNASLVASIPFHPPSSNHAVIVGIDDAGTK